MINLILRKHKIKFSKGKGSLTIPLGKNLIEEKKDGEEGDKHQKNSSFKEWNKSLKSK